MPILGMRLATPTAKSADTNRGWRLLRMVAFVFAAAVLLQGMIGGVSTELAERITYLLSNSIRVFLRDWGSTVDVWLPFLGHVALGVGIGVLWSLFGDSNLRLSGGTGTGLAGIVPGAIFFSVFALGAASFQVPTLGSGIVFGLIFGLFTMVLCVIQRHTQYHTVRFIGLR